MAARARGGISQFRFARMTGPRSKSACNLPIAPAMPCDDTWRDAATHRAHANSNFAALPRYSAGNPDAIDNPPRRIKGVT